MDITSTQKRLSCVIILSSNHPDILYKSAADCSVTFQTSPYKNLVAVPHSGRVKAANTMSPEKSSAASPPPDLDLSDPKVQAMKARILTHMSADHADSLALYLQHYCLLPPSQAPLNPTPPPGTLQLEDISLDHMIISHSSGRRRNLIPIAPPMTSLSEARERLVSMHHASLRALDLADFRITRVVPPNKPWQWLIHAAVAVTLFTFVLWPSPASFEPGSGHFPAVFWSLGGLTPWLARLAARLRAPVLAFILVVHTAEAAWFARARLRRYWVPPFSGALWWGWVAVVWLGGVAGIARFDDYVAGLERERAAKQKQPGKH